MEGVRLCARFSLPTSRMRYCGPDYADSLLERAIAKGEDLPAARNALAQFEALTPYLDAIAAKHGLDPFDAKVVEAYWIGNELLDGFTKEEFRAILAAFEKRGLPPTVSARIAANLPEDPLPHHAFHVVFVGVGQVSGKVETTLENMDKCRPSWARVLEVEENSATASRPTLQLRDGRLGNGPPERVEFQADPRFLPGLAAGDWIAFHWYWPAVILDPRQLDALRTYTAKAFEAATDLMLVVP